MANEQTTGQPSPTNLSQEDLDLLHNLASNGFNTSNSGWSTNMTNPWTGGMVGNNYWTPTYTGNNGGVTDSSDGSQPTITGYMRDVVAGHHNIGDMQDMYDTNGNYLGTKAIPKTDPIGEYLVPALMAGWGMAAAGGLMGGAAAGGADAGVGAAVDPMMYGGSGAADWGAGAAASGAGAGVGAEVDPMMYGGSGADTWGAGEVAAGTGDAAGTFNAAKDSELASEQLGLTPADVTAGGVPSVSVPGAGIPGTNTTPDFPTTGTDLPGGGTPIPKVPVPGGGSGNPAGGGDGGGGFPLGSLLSLLGGAYGMNQQNQASQQMLDYLKSRQDMNDNMYKPGSPEYNALWDQMSRKDAAAGRNSQYGPRSVDLAARIAQLKMDANTKMTTGIGNLEANAINQGANSYLNMLPFLTGLSGSGSGTSSGGGINDIVNWLSKNFNIGGGGDSYGTGFDPSLFNDDNNPLNIGPFQ